MAISVQGYENHVRMAVSHYWATLESQRGRQSATDADRGRRAAVTGGKQMDGFCRLFEWVLRQNGLTDASLYHRSRLELPGYFRPTKKWDMLVVHEGHLVAAIEFKSQRGPSFGNNFNNRTEEALGSATDLWTAYRDGAYGEGKLRPWLGWLMLLEESSASTRPISVKEPHFKVFPEFHDSSYAKRYEIQLRRLVAEGHFNAAGLLMSTEESGPAGRYREPTKDLSMKAMIASIAGHAAAYLASL